MKRLAGKVAIVTGASKGIGAAAAKALTAEGAAVAVNYPSGKQGAERVVSQIAREDGKTIAIQADVSKEIDVKCLFDETEEAFGSPNVLVNNAGVFKFGPLEAITEEEFHREFDTNRSRVRILCRTRPSIPRLRVRWTLSRWRWLKSWGHETSGLISSRRAWSIPKATEKAGLSAAKPEMREHWRRRSARDSASRRKLRRSSFLPRRTVQPG